MAGEGIKGMRVVRINGMSIAIGDGVILHMESPSTRTHSKTKLILGKRGSGKTYKVAEIAAQTKASFLAYPFYEKGMAQKFLNKDMPKDFCPKCQVVSLEQSLSGIKELAIDQVDILLRMLLEKHYNFTGRIVAMSMGTDDNMEVKIIEPDKTLKDVE